MNRPRWSKWQRDKDIVAPKIRYSHAASSSERYMLIHGGYYNIGGPQWLDDTWCFIKRGSTWSWNQLDFPQHANKPAARYSHTLVNLNMHHPSLGVGSTSDVFSDVFYLFGGDDGGHSIPNQKGYAVGHYYNDLWKLEIRLISGSRMHMQGTWTQLSIESPVPTPRTSHTAVALLDVRENVKNRDLRRRYNMRKNTNMMVLFGGLTVKRSLKVELVESNQLWIMEFDKNKSGEDVEDNDDVKWILWTLNSASTSISMPLPRHGHSATTDQKRNIMYIFGGQSQTLQTLLQDLWSWNRIEGWSLLHNPVHNSINHNYPTGLLYSSMGWLRSNQLVLFGGARGCSSRCFTESKTWIWDMKTHLWTLSSVSRNDPTHRYRQTLVNLVHVEGKTQQHIMFGGESYGALQKYHNDVWFLESSFTSISTRARMEGKSHMVFSNFAAILSIFGCSLILLWLLLRIKNKQSW